MGVFATATFTSVIGAILLARRGHRTAFLIVPEVGARRALTLLVRNRTVASLALVVVFAEVFGFLSAALVPTFAKDVLDKDAAGLGILVAARALGGVIGLAWLTLAGTRQRGGRTLLAATAAFGAFLVVFAVSGSFALSTVVMLAAGSTAACIDTLGQTMLQQAASDRERGAAMGVWVFSIGFGPIGFIVLGAAATVYGAEAVQVASGLLLVTFAVAMAALTRLPALQTGASAH